MEYMPLQKNLKTLQALYPNHVDGDTHQLSIEAIPGLPAWIKGLIEVYQVPFQGVPSAPLYLILPKEKIQLEHLIRIYKLIAEKLKRHVLVVADNLPAKHRPLLVKFRIPFIYKDESIFAPELGLKFGNLKKFEADSKLEIEKGENPLTPFELKIIAGLLTNQIPHEFTLKLLHEKLQKKSKFSPSKLNVALNDLAANGILLVHGAGPHKRYAKNTVQKIWEKALAKSFAPFFRETQTNYVPKNQKAYVIAGETALAHYSNLASPKQAIIAMTPAQFRNTFQGPAKETIPFGDFGNPNTVQIWKEDPHLFSIDGMMNPIEIFFSMRHHHDERVQMSIDEMLKPYGLSKESK